VTLDRYNGKKKDLIDHILGLEKRLRALETSPQASFTAVSRNGITINDDGSITVVKANGNSIVINPNSTTEPEIRFVPNDNPTNYSSMISAPGTYTAGEAKIVIYSGIDAGTGLGTRIGVSADRGILYAGPAAGGAVTYDGGIHGIDGARAYVMVGDDIATPNQLQPGGGYIDLFSDQAWMGLWNTNTTWWYFNDAANTVSYFGRWENAFDDGATQGLIMGRPSAGTIGDTSYAVTYGSTKSTTVAVVAVLEDTANHSQSLRSVSTSGFTLAWTTGSSAAEHVNFWAFRL
jgi:hypothetical protein